MPGDEQERTGWAHDERREQRERGTEGEASASPRECHRRGCAEPAAFVVLERYQEETGQGAVEATAYLCRDHTAEESPTNLDKSYPDYVFLVEPLPERERTDSA